jgi:hypothetical protein
VAASTQKGNTMSNSQASNQKTKRFRIVVFEWLSHDAEIEATDAAAAEEQARQLWADNAEQQSFSFDHSGIDGVHVEEIA